MKILTKLPVIVDRVVDFLAILAAACIIGIMLLMCYEVVMRYFFNIGSAWAVELTEYGLFLLAFLGATWLLKREGHVRVDLAVNRLSPKGQALMNTATSILGILVCLIITWYAAESAWDHFERGIPVVKTLRVPKAPFLAVISLSSFLLAIQFLRQAYGHLKNWSQAKEKVYREGFDYG